jgi:uncharacterized ion transporter superfamily protein YfcC
MSTLLWIIIVWIIFIIFTFFWSYRYGMTIGADYENIILLKKKEQRKELQEILEEEGIEKHR